MVSNDDGDAEVAPGLQRGVEDAVDGLALFLVADDVYIVEDEAAVFKLLDRDRVGHERGVDRDPLRLNDVKALIFL